MGFRNEKKTMKFAQVAFDMNYEVHPTGSVNDAQYMLKRWKKYTIYSHTGPWNRTDNPRDNTYTTNSIYLYDYVMVSNEFWNNMVYTASVANSDPGNPGSEVLSSDYWYHYANTFKNSPNATTNNYYYNYFLPMPYSNPNRWEAIPGSATQTSEDTYFELVTGYPRNHYSHKGGVFSLSTIKTYGRNFSPNYVGTFARNRQSLDTTIGADGLTNGTAPVESFMVSDVNVVQSNNAINE